MNLVKHMQTAQGCGACHKLKGTSDQQLVLEASRRGITIPMPQKMLAFTGSQAAVNALGMEERGESFFPGLPLGPSPGNFLDSEKKKGCWNQKVETQRAEEGLGGQ